MTAVAACPTCGTQTLREARFCHACGCALAQHESSAEYKQVTVLFADVVRSMDIATAVGAERLREIMAELVGRAALVVQHFGGTVDKFTGDGIMAVFGAPVALEDHAVRACLAALGVQDEAGRLGIDIHARDGIELLLRVGLNSGQVIAGETGPFGYTAVGDQVGMAQRMESVAPPGGVMLSESTARLVESAAVLGDRQLVRIKGSAEAVPTYPLKAVAAQADRTRRSETALVGRQWELNAVAAVLDRAATGQGCIVGVAGPAGIGKSRLVIEAAALARRRGVEVLGTFCESHTSDVPFHVVARLLREASRITDLNDAAARGQVAGQFADAGDEDLLLLYDLMGIRDPTVTMPNIDPDARRRRLTALINSMSLASTTPALYVVEDVHWIDSVSESMFADLMTVIPHTHSVVLLTYRPDYRGALANLAGAQTISLAPLTESETTALLGELLGTDPSVAAINGLISGRASGNPFFAQEMVRELAERGVLEGKRGRYVCRTDVADVSVPATLQAAIAARIDRLGAAPKQTINAAAVIGSRFTVDLLTALGVEPALHELIGAELIDQVRFTPYPEYAFRHPVIRAVAYESQLKSARAQLHRRLAEAIESRDPASAEENASLIAEHLEAAGDLQAAYEWHMRSGAWSSYRDIDAARLSWRRALRVADSLPADLEGTLVIRIAPRTMLCGTTWRGTPEPAAELFEQLRELCAEAGDKVSLAIAMTGMVSEHWRNARMQMAQEVACEQIALVESLGNPALAASAVMSIAVRSHAGATGELLRWCELIIDWASGDASQDNVVAGSPLALALAFRGFARWWHGRTGWREDLQVSQAMARSADPATLGLVTAWNYGLPSIGGVSAIDNAALNELENALQVAEACGNNYAAGSIKYTLGPVLWLRGGATDRQRGRELLARARDMSLTDQFPRSELALIDLFQGYDRALEGDYDNALPRMRKSIDELSNRHQFVYQVGALPLLVQTLLRRGFPGDLAEAEALVQRLAAIPGAEWVARDIMVLRLRTLLAHARSEDGYRELRDRYRALAASLGFDGHMQWASELP
ncbi:cyclase [Mycobacterium sp. 852002-51163_SCH5372311]|uniref:ATP-binding protein n=1 Tax=Mycobacterium sp. 852002-51163_SCH5372311 TaxID=1834097 RepID=UPI0007FC1CBC|nr:adenylate/guanylate cyclase domain-containing protein [Mycobacterium sp. 852002-51163_SCH5372311]OBF80701.1 cyclase [Mycobacterium sp. 852002-51163_SCH5372311]